MIDLFELFPDLKISFSWFLKFFLLLISATISGGIIGLERELLAKPAGLKTLVFVTVGSSLFSFFSFELGKVVGGDPLRIASNIATGIGFLGAGTIIRRGEWIEGLTTASLIWFCGALGIIVGSGYFLLAIFCSAGGFVFLKSLEFLEEKFLSARKCKVMSMRAIFPEGKKDEILNFSKSFFPACSKVPHKIFVHQDQDGNLIFEFEGCERHTKNITILRSSISSEIRKTPPT
jgi:uncharacterized membrane protein YhiD involved in acid resistance